METYRLNDEQRPFFELAAVKLRLLGHEEMAGRIQHTMLNWEYMKNSSDCPERDRQVVERWCKSVGVSL